MSYLILRGDLPRAQVRARGAAQADACVTITDVIRT